MLHFLSVGQAVKEPQRDHRAKVPPQSCNIFCWVVFLASAKLEAGIRAGAPLIIGCCWVQLHCCKTNPSHCQISTFALYESATLAYAATVVAYVALYNCVSTLHSYNKDINPLQGAKLQKVLSWVQAGAWDGQQEHRIDCQSSKFPKFVEFSKPFAARLEAFVSTGSK